MDYPAAIYLLAPLAVGLGYVIFGITGFGATIMMVPVLAHLLPISFVVPLCLLLDLSATLILPRRKSAVRDTGEIRWLLPFMLTGMAAGAYLLVATPDKWLMLALGMFVVGYALLSLTLLRSHAGAMSRGWGAALAVVGGIASSLYGTGGLIYAIYVARRVADPGRLRATMSAIVAISAVVRIVMFLVAGLLLKASLGLAWLALCPFMWAGLTIGSALHDRLDLSQVRRVVYVFLLLSGGSLVVRALTYPV